MSKHLFKILLVVIAIESYKSLVIPDLQTADSEIHRFKHGGGSELGSEYFTEHGQKGEKGYAEEKKEEAGGKGHHDKGNYKGSYAEAGGKKDGHHHDDGYYSEYHKGDGGEKGYHYEEKGSYAKGYSTKGGHKVRKLDEFKKETEFYDEDHDEGHKESYGGHEEKYGKDVGSSVKGGHHNHKYSEGEFGKSGKEEKGFYFDEDKGHKKADGHLENYADGEKYGKEGGYDQSQIWGHKD